jgi:membrane-bound ClpP family serine protease
VRFVIAGCKSDSSTTDIGTTGIVTTGIVTTGIGTTVIGYNCYRHNCYRYITDIGIQLLSDTTVIGTTVIAIQLISPYNCYRTQLLSATFLIIFFMNFHLCLVTVAWRFLLYAGSILIIIQTCGITC